VGTGKTTLMTGLLNGLGYSQNVPSPTYTISRIYPVKGGLEVHHFDFYRLRGWDVAANELAEVLGSPRVIVAVEWSTNMENILPSDHLRIELKSGINEHVREISVSALGAKHKQIVERLM
jgi:tRNA threonylcarbamoyladenosine biosynthesis protein TsaE